MGTGAADVGEASNNNVTAAANAGGGGSKTRECADTIPLTDAAARLPGFSPDRRTEGVLGAQERAR